MALTLHPLQAAPGDLDNSFGTAGKASITGVDGIDCVARQSDGKILVGGSHGNDFAVARLTATGVFDSTFGTGGKVTTDFNSNSDGVNRVAVQSDGRIIAVGTSYDTVADRVDVALARYQTNGSLDTTFGTGGKVVTNFSSDDRAHDVAIQADGKILIAGLARIGGDYTFLVARYTTAGALDATFGTGGRVATSVAGSSAALRLTLQSDGKILVVGGAGNGSTGVVRYLSSGALDGGFGTGGIAYTGLRNQNAVAIQADGKILVSGTTGALDDQFGITRFLANGEMDGSFGYFGSTNTAIGTNGSVSREILFRSDWKIVVVGFATNGANTDFALAQYHPNGSLDTGFGTGGKVTASMSAGNDYAMSALLQPDGKIVVAGSPSVAARFEGGAIPNYSPPGVATTATTNLTTTGATINGTVNPSGTVTTAYFEYGLTAAYGTTINVPVDPNTGTSNSSVSANLSGLPPATTYHYRLVANNTGGTAATPNATFTTVTPAPEISLFAGPDISAPSLTDGQTTAVDFGATILGVPVVRSFTVRNTGTGDLLLSGLVLPAGFALQGGGTPDVTVPPSGTQTFSVAFLANTAGGSFGGTLSLLNNDSNESSYDIPLTAFAMGTGGGSQDRSFAANGIAATDFSGTNDQAHDVAVQADGKIVVAGFTRVGSSDDFALARYLPGGGLDPAFGIGGKVVTPVSTSSDAARAVAVQSDGKIVAAGFARVNGNDEFAIARYLSNGSLDLSFGTGGTLIVPIGTGSDQAFALALQSDGKIVVGGQATSASVDFALIRCLPDGSLDPDFGTGGKVVTPIGAAADICRSLAIQSNGMIVAGGEANMGSTNKDFALVRYTTAGILDNTFATAGKLTVDITANSQDSAYGLALRGDGGIVAAGETSSAFALIACLADGSLDPGFGTSGIFRIAAAANTAHLRGDLAQDADGKLLVAGQIYNVSRYEMAMLRCHPDGSVDTGFGNAGWVRTRVGTSHDYCTSIALNSNDGILLGGYFTNGGNTDFALLQFIGGDQVFPAPTVETLAATGVTENSAVLNGTANPRGIHTSTWFEYGTNPSYGSITAPVPQGFGTSPVNVAEGLNGLTPGLTYHFRLVAQNAGAISRGADMTFTVGTPVVLSFADANLEAAVRAAIGKPTGVIYGADVIPLVSLNLANLGIGNLDGLEAATNLRILDIRNNPFSDAAATWGILNQLSLYCLYTNLPRPGGPPPGLLTEAVSTGVGNFYITLDPANLPSLDISGLGIDTTNPANLDALDRIAAAGVTVVTGAANLPPAATGTATVTSQATGATTLNGSASRDIDGTVVAWAWTWAGGSAAGGNPTAIFPVGTTTLTLTVTDDDGAIGITTLQVQVLGAPEIALEQPAGTELTGANPTVTFPARRVGSSSEATVFTIRNSGTAALLGIVVQVAPAGSDFSLDLTGTATSLAPGATTTFSILFTPSEIGPRSASLAVTSNDADENPTTIGLAGVGLNPAWNWTNYSGQAGGLGNADGTGAAARFDNPAGIVADGNGGFFVADSNNHVIRRISSAGVVTPFAGSTQIPGSTNGTGTAASFRGPSGLAMKPGGTLVVADTINHTIRQVSSGGVVTLVAGLPGVVGSQSGTGTGARFLTPRAVAVDQQMNIYVADSGNHTIRKIDISGEVTLFAGAPGQAGSVDGPKLNARFNNPRGIAVDPGGMVYVSEWGNHTIRRIDPSGNVITLAGTSGVSGSTNASGPAARFNRPSGISLDPNGMILVADTDNHLIRSVTPAGGVSTVTVIEAPGVAAIFKSPAAVIDDGSALFVADTANSMIRKIDPESWVTTLAGTSPQGGNVDGNLAAARYLQPVGGVFDAAGNLYLADTGNHNIRKILPNGTVSVFAGGGVSGFVNGTGPAARFNRPTEIVLAPGGNLLVSDKGNGRIRQITPAGEVTTYAGIGGAGLINGTALTARFNNPHGMAFDSDGNLFIADVFNQVIRKLDTDGNVTTFAGAGGQIGGIDGTATAARFNQPTGLAIDPSNNLYVTCAAGHTIRRITPAAEVTTLAGADGIWGGADGIGTAARFWNPLPIAWHPDGYLVAGDWLGHTIRRIDPSGEVTTIGGLGGAGTDADGYGQESRFSRPAGIVVRPDLSLLVMDSYNNRLVAGTPPVTGGIGFADPLLEAAIRSALAKPTGTITGADMMTLTNLNLSALGLTDLSGLEAATNLRILNLRGNAFTNPVALWAILDQLSLYCLYIDVPRPGANPPGLLTQTVTDTTGGIFFITVNAPNLPTLDVSGLNIDISNPANQSALQTFSSAGINVIGVPNSPPVAGASATVLDLAARSVVLDGGSSSDSDGSIVSWAWTWSTGSATGSSPTVTLPAGVTTITLNVTDDDGASGETTLTMSLDPGLITAFVAAGLSGSDALPEAIPFNDGVENILKYAFNMNLAGPDVSNLSPGSGTGGLPSITTPDDAPPGTIHVEFVRRKGSGLIYTPQKSTTLDGPGWAPLSATPVVTSINDQWERVVYVEPPAPVPAPVCFGRVSVSIP